MDFIFGRYSLIFYTGMLTALSVFAALASPLLFFLTAFFGALFLLGIADYSQKKRAVLGNYPLLGRFRFFFESIRPELRQYFWESDSDELPYSRDQRSMVYQRSKAILAARPFGSKNDMYAEDFSWLNHSLQPTHIENKDFRIRVGEDKSLTIFLC